MDVYTTIVRGRACLMTSSDREPEGFSTKLLRCREIQTHAGLEPSLLANEEGTAGGISATWTVDIKGTTLCRPQRENVRERT